MLAVAAAFARCGHKVTFASGPVHERDASRAGARFVELPKTPPADFERLRPYEDAARSARSFLPALAEIRPDVVVHDVITLGPAFAAEVLGAAVVTLVIHPLHTPSRELPPFGVGEPPGGSPVRRLWHAWMRRNNRVKDLAPARDAYNLARAGLGLPPIDHLNVGLSDRLALVATLPSLEIMRSDWPPQAHVIGPCVWDPEPARAVDIPPGADPLVLVAPSTAFGGSELALAAAKSVEALGVRAVFAAGKATLPDPLPAGTVSTADGSHASVLPHASAVICHGGHGTIVRALSHGVPCVVVPGHGDQNENAYRVEHVGAGLRVSSPDPKRLTGALRRVLGEPSFRARARELQLEAASLDGPTRAAELVEESLQRRQSAPA
jgi:UDP:flavonoid glycosyltransferase YjiC (YdhE family)